MSSITSPSSQNVSSSRASPERTAELAQNLSEILSRIQTTSQLFQASQSSPETQQQNVFPPQLVAVSKYKPSSDILACYELGQRDFGENYIQELVEKVNELPQDIRWHFIGTFQTNKSKLLAGIQNLHTLQTLTSIKAADTLNRALPPERESSPLNVLLQVNTSGEDVKSGLPPLADSASEIIDENTKVTEETKCDDGLALLNLAAHVLENCPRLYLQGLMTIGSLSESLSGADENRDFKILVQTRDRLDEVLRKRYPDGGKWDESRRLLLSMGMSNDFEAAIKSGSDIVRVGTGVFGQRHLKGEK